MSTAVLDRPAALRDLPADYGDVTRLVMPSTTLTCSTCTRELAACKCTVEHLAAADDGGTGTRVTNPDGTDAIAAWRAERATS